MQRTSVHSICAGGGGQGDEVTLRDVNATMDVASIDVRSNCWETTSAAAGLPGSGCPQAQPPFPHATAVAKRP
jgi:hypothetical protein